MSTVQDMLEAKGKEIWSIEPEKTVYDAIAMMADRHVGALTVVESDKLLGIVSERDYARRVILEERVAAETLVRDIMTSDPIVVSSDDSVDHCMALMSQNRIRHLPVVDGADLVGIIAVDDVLRAVIRDQSNELEALESLIKNEEGGSG